jgi:hypothetical protein
MLRPVGPFNPRTCICVFDFSELACTDETIDDACVDKIVLEFPFPVVQPEAATSMTDANTIEIILPFNRNFILYTSLYQYAKTCKVSETAALCICHLYRIIQLGKIIGKKFPKLFNGIMPMLFYLRV